jgi:hypothetical protein
MLPSIVLLLPLAFALALSTIALVHPEPVQVREVRHVRRP